MIERVARLESPRRHGGGRRAQQEQRIIDSVGKLLAENDITEVSVEDILAEAKVARRTFYSYYEGKYDALAAAMRAFREVLEPSGDELPCTRAEFLAWIRADLERVHRVWMDHEPIWMAGVKVYHLDRTIQALGQETHRGFLRRWVPVLTVLQAKGLIRPPVDDLAWTAAAICAMRDHHFFVDAIAGASDEDRSRTLDRLLAATVAMVGLVPTRDDHDDD